MLASRLSTLASMALLSSACGCILGSGPAKEVREAPKAEAKAPGARVADSWQDRMLKLLQDDRSGATDAYGLFSEGGWSDSGQVMVLSGDKKRRLVTVDPGKQVFNIDREFNANEWATLEAAIKAAGKLNDVDITAFDAVVFEYVHARKEKSGVTVQKRVFVRNPGTKPTPDHDKLIQAFQTLRK